MAYYSCDREKLIFFNMEDKIPHFDNICNVLDVDDIDYQVSFRVDHKETWVDTTLDIFGFPRKERYNFVEFLITLVPGKNPNHSILEPERYKENCLIDSHPIFRRIRLITGIKPYSYSINDYFLTFYLK